MTDEKPLTRSTSNLYHFIDGKKITGPNENMFGKCTNLSGNLDKITNRPSDLVDHIKPEKQND